VVRREPLNREKVLDAALELAGRHGLDGLSMRRLAKELGVEAMSLYNHVANKGDLLDGLAERVFAQVERPDPAWPWQQRVRATALSMYTALSRYPFVPLALVTDQANPTSRQALQPLDDVIAALSDAGFDDVGIRQALGTVNSVIFGSLLLVTGGFTGGVDGSTDIGPFVNTIDAGQLPHFSRMLPTLAAGVPALDFERALDLVVGGLEAAAPVSSRRRS
jgi:TetR/AcrR family tetracycline transcriptional repressor